MLIGSSAAQIFKISQSKAKILNFEVGPKSDLCLYMTGRGMTLP